MKRWKEITTDQFRLSQSADNQYSAFISDELACQLLVFEYPHQVFDTRYNASPIYHPGGWEDAKDVRVWHGHGAKFFKTRRPDIEQNRINGIKRQNGLWLPVFFAARAVNWCRLNAWHNEPRMGRKRPSTHVEQLEEKYQYWLEHGSIPEEIEANAGLYLTN